MEKVEVLFDKRSVVGAKLLSILQERDYTKTDLCKKVGISRPTLDKLLAGTLTNKTNYEKHIEKILNYLEITPDMLLGNTVYRQNRTRRIRNMIGITTEEISQMTGISLERLQRIERGEAGTLAEFRDIAMCLSTSTNVLSGRYFFEPQVGTLDIEILDEDYKGELSGFWGHVGILLDNSEEYCWYPITVNTRSLILRMMEAKRLVIPCMNNKVLLLCMEHVKEIVLLDDACDEPVEMNWDSTVSCGEIPLVVYEALEDYLLFLWEDEGDRFSNKMKGCLENIIEDKKWSEEDIRQILAETCIYYASGHKETVYIDFHNRESLSSSIIEIYDFEETEDSKDILFFTEENAAEHIVNMKKISMIELPLLQVENAICESWEF